VEAWVVRVRTHTTGVSPLGGLWLSQIRVDGRGYVAHSPLKPEIVQKTAKGIRGGRELTNVELLSPCNPGLCLLAPDC
jgi:hypothetical protein